jgi:molecular chaperone Hsp33
MAEEEEGGELRRFLLEQYPVRGHWVQLGQAWPDMRAYRDYPAVVQALLGEAATAAVLLAATLKFDGQLTLQLSGNGRMKLLVAQCSRDFQVRAVAHHDLEDHEFVPFDELIGDGRLVVSLDSDRGGARYQGVVQLEGRGLAECLEKYFAESEQLPTRLVLYADAERAAGFLLQKLPAASEGGEAEAARAEEVWEELQLGLESLQTGTLSQGTVEAAIREVFGPHDCRLFEADDVTFGCRCSAERVGEVLRTLGEPEAREVLKEQGAITVTCEFCARPYRFDAVDVERLFAPAVVVSPGTGAIN